MLSLWNHDTLWHLIICCALRDGVDAWEGNSRNKNENIDDIKARTTSVTMFKELEFSAVGSRDMQGDGVDEMAWMFLLSM